MKQIGIFLGYLPNQPLRKEGLGRLVAFLLGGMTRHPDLHVTVACPRWYKKELEGLLADHGLQDRPITFLMPPRNPLALRFWPHKKRKTRKTNRFPLFAERLLTALYEKIVACAASPSLVKAVPAVVGMILLSPFLVLGVGIIGGGAYIAHRALQRVIKWTLPLQHHFKERVLMPFWTQFKTDMRDQMQKDTLDDLVQRINRHKKIEAWLIPTLFWPEAGGIQARKVVAVPDLVFLEFPTHYAHEGVPRLLDRHKKSIATADHLITYSAYVRDAHLGRGLGVPPEKTTPIRHGRLDLSPYLRTPDEPFTPATRRARAAALLREAVQDRLKVDPHERHIDFEKTPYLFYASQVRPNKNIFSLLRLIAWLNRDQKRAMRLVLTCDFRYAPRLAAYITTHHLEEYVVCWHDIPSEILAALNALATLCITPTLFEGGFPFTFCEAFSVGTPSLLSAIPVVQEGIAGLNPELIARTLFNPYDFKALQAKTLWALDHRAELYALQQELFDAHPTWDQVAERYVEVLTGRPCPPHAAPSTPRSSLDAAPRNAED